MGQGEGPVAGTPRRVATWESTESRCTADKPKGKGSYKLVGKQAGGLFTASFYCCCFFLVLLCCKNIAVLIRYY